MERYFAEKVLSLPAGSARSHSPTLSFKPRRFGQHLRSLSKLTPTHIGTLQWLCLNP